MYKVVFTHSLSCFCGEIYYLWLETIQQHASKCTSFLFTVVTRYTTFVICNSLNVFDKYLLKTQCYNGENYCVPKYHQ